MQELDDIELLREYVERDSEAAFAALVERHINKIYSVTLRRTGNPHQAEEITQAVFVILARKARQLSRGVILYSWLYKTARLTSAAFIRGEIRRTRREQEACMQNVNETSESEVWPQIAPLLDSALAALNETDRRALMLRFFYGKSMKEIGANLDANEDATKKRVGRALEKLQNYFFKHGVRSTTSALENAILANSVLVAPAALAKSVTAVAIAKGATASTSTLTLIKGALKIMAWTKAKIAVVAGVAVILATGTTTVMVRHLEHSSRARLDPTPANEGAFQRESMQRVNQGKQWGLAFRLFASDHGGQLPTSIAQLKSYAPGVSDLNWEIVSGGTLDSIGDPGKTILMQDKEPRQSPDGRFHQEYVFADGSVQQDSRPDDDFAALEKERGYLVHPAKN